MSVVNFDRLPDTTRLWIYGTEKTLGAKAVADLSNGMDRFMQEWTAHKRELRTGWKLQYHQFVMVAVDESQMAASGCSIDSMVSTLRNLESVVGAEIVGTSGKVFYRDDQNAIQCVDRLEFKKVVQIGVVNFETIVFDNTIQTLGDLRRDRWELPMRDSWHKTAFGKVVV